MLHAITATTLTDKFIVKTSNLYWYTIAPNAAVLVAKFSWDVVIDVVDEIIFINGLSLQPASNFSGFVDSVSEEN